MAPPSGDCDARPGCPFNTQLWEERHRLMLVAEEENVKAHAGIEQRLSGLEKAKLMAAGWIGGVSVVWTVLWVFQSAGLIHFGHVPGPGVK